MTHLFDPLRLPCGTTLPNRIAKAATEEDLAVAGQLPGEHLTGAYRRWAAGGAGLLITGNVMVDGTAVTSPGNVVLEEGAPLAPFRAWAAAATSGGGQAWMQLNHPGRQVMADLGNIALAPSAVPLALGKHSKRFASPKAMDEAQIDDVMRRFAVSARLASEAGFGGVQIHAAHGYLLSQFLSPLANRRTDQWGGRLEDRARLLLAVVDAVRAAVPAAFAVGVKLNSADFQRGGFDADDARQVVAWLDGRGVDLVELSGGSFESPAMQGRTADSRTLDREAYFLRFAAEIAAVATMPVMTTGGVRRRETVERVLAEGVDVVGLANALILAPDLPAAWRGGERAVCVPSVGWSDRMLAAAAGNAVMRWAIADLARRPSAPRPHHPIAALIRDRLRRLSGLRRYRAWRATRADAA